MPAGTYDIEVTLADSGDVALTVPGMVLEGDTTYDLVLMGQPGDEDHPLELRPLSDTTEQSTPAPLVPRVASADRATERRVPEKERGGLGIRLIIGPAFGKE